MADLLLSDDEIVTLTGYRQPARQLEELHRQGFYRARRRAMSGAVVLERAHYEAVCGIDKKAAEAPRARQPQLRPA